MDDAVPQTVDLLPWDRRDHFLHIVAKGFFASSPICIRLKTVASTRIGSLSNACLVGQSAQ